MAEPSVGPAAQQATDTALNPEAARAMSISGGSLVNARSEDAKPAAEACSIASLTIMFCTRSTPIVEVGAGP